MPSTLYDVAVIGGGIVGTATALALVQSRPGLKLVILEAEGRLAVHQTGRNSGVIHSGLYYKPGSLKARNCVEGREAMYRFCGENGIPAERTGKVVVAVLPAELPALEKLEQRGRENGLQGIRRLTPDEIREFEPHAAGIAGLFVPQTGIVDYRLVNEKFGQLVQSAGGEILTGARVTGFQKSGGGFILTTPRGEIAARTLINCAGLHSDQVARLCGVEPGMQIMPFRGEYYEIVPEKHHLVNNLIYPVPDVRFPFLGVHFTRMARGGVEAGPNAVIAFKREGYSWGAFSAADVWQFLTYSGFWRMGLKYWRMGFGEIYRSLNKRAFVRALQRLVPELRDEDLRRGGAGVRAQALAPDGALIDDFVIREAERQIHVLNAPSPAATASISIGRAIAEMAARNL